MANIEDIKKFADEKGVEISDEMLEAIAGGRYTLEEWDNMTDEERIAAFAESTANRAVGKPCKLD
ncbi:MAG: hypothetical protein UIH27_19600 [Ruminococcus sp.]|nr:hypothetical protein [Ruminococcus sp.]